MLFSYTAVSKDGKEHTATLEAVDKFALYKAVHANGDTVLSVREASGKKFSFKLSFSFGGASMTDRIMFAKNLSAMLRAGLPLARGLAILEKQMSNKQMKKVCGELADHLAKGDSFAMALRAYPKTFPALFVAMVAAGEESGNLVGSLQVVADQLEKSYLLQKKVKGAMMYPAIIISLMAVIGVLMFIYVVPKLTETFKSFNVELPIQTRMILGTSDFVMNYYIYIIIVLVLIVSGVWSFSRTVLGKKIIHRTILKIPVIGGIAVEVNSARVSRTLSSLLSSGVDIVHSIRIVSDVVQNVHYKTMLSEAAEKIQKGDSVQSLFLPRNDLYPPFVGEMIGVGEETGTLSKVLLEVALFYEGEVEQKTKDISTIIEPTLMVVIGVGVGFFALAIISPIYSLSENI
jgi:type IV pilus assembly protein PilC